MKLGFKFSPSRNHPFFATPSYQSSGPHRLSNAGYTCLIARHGIPAIRVVCVGDDTVDLDSCISVYYILVDLDMTHNSLLLVHAISVKIHYI